MIVVQTLSNLHVVVVPIVLEEIQSHSLFPKDSSFIVNKLNRFTLHNVVFIVKILVVETALVHTRNNVMMAAFRIGNHKRRLCSLLKPLGCIEYQGRRLLSISQNRQVIRTQMFPQ